MEPFEYGDKYAPWKYGIIFKEKIFVGPDHTSAALNIRLKRGANDLTEKRLFKVEVLDQGKVIYQQLGYNQITIGHFMFRSSNALPEASADADENTEVKH